MATQSEARFTIGDWTFAARSHELTCEGARVRLERRTAAVLEYLCEHRGEVVPRAALIAHIWGERHVSGNSLPTAIHDLRRALGDDAKRPRYLETVSKGGYRLITTPAPRAEAIPSDIAAARRRFLRVAAYLGVGGAGLAALAATSLGGFAQPARPTIFVTELSNETGNPAYDTLAQASESVLLTALHRHDRFTVRRVGSSAPAPRRGDIHLTARLVLWSDLPDIVLVAEDPQTAALIWSGYAFGPESTLPGRIDETVAEFFAASRSKPAV